MTAMTSIRSLSFAAALGAVALAPAAARATDIDVLFVIDDSGSMGEEQVALASGGFANFLAQLDLLDGGVRPNLHVGVVSSNVGVGGFNINGCTGNAGNGDDGILQNAATGACTPPSGYYISDIANPDGTRLVNYSGTLPAVFSCIAQLGTDGCGFEQHLTSMRRALDGSNPQNAGFLRPDAWLVVVVLADEDDCSALDPSVFDPSQISVTDPLGPLSSFRCTEFGVQCATPGGPITRAAGAYDTCAGQVGSPYIRHPSEFADFLKSLKADPSRIIVGAITGEPAPFSVILDMDGEPALSPSCMSPTGLAAPAVRLQEFLAEFPGRNFFRSLCSDLPTSFGEIGGAVHDTITAMPPLPVPDAGPTPGATDAAVDAVWDPITDAGLPGADAAPGTPDAAGTGGTGESSGCGCQVGGRAPFGPLGTIVAGAALLLLAAGSRSGALQLRCARVRNDRRARRRR